MKPRLWYLALAGSLLVLVGVWGPWVPHQAAGLVLSGWDLNEYVKFLPGVRAGTTSVIRELFYLPVWSTGLGLALLAHRPLEGQVGWGRRLALMALGLTLVTLVLPPYPFIKTAYQSGELQGQFYLGLLGGLLVLLSPLSQRLPDRLLGGLLFLLAGMGGGLALWQFVVVRPKIQALYGSTLGVGWGLIVLALGLGALMTAGVWTLVGGHREPADEAVEAPQPPEELEAVD